MVCNDARELEAFGYRSVAGFHLNFQISSLLDLKPAALDRQKLRPRASKRAPIMTCFFLLDAFNQSKVELQKLGQSRVVA